MTYVLETRQGETRQLVGIFGDEADLVRFIESVPGARRISTDNGSSFALDLDALPELAEVVHNGWSYVVSRSTYSTYPSEPDEIEFLWTEVCDFDKPVGEGMGPHYSGLLHVDGYMMAMGDAPDHIRQREQLFEEARAYADAHCLQATRAGLGTQDGEYVRFTELDSDAGSIAFLLDPMTLRWRAESASFEEFLSSLPQRLRDL